MLFRGCLASSDGHTRQWPTGCFTGRKGNEQRCRITASQWKRTQPMIRTIPHNPGTAHFRCQCGEHLVFNSAPGPFTSLSNLRRDGSSKTGRSPKCDLVHSVRNASATKGVEVPAATNNVSRPDSLECPKCSFRDPLHPNQWYTISQRCDLSISLVSLQP